MRVKKDTNYVLNDTAVLLFRLFHNFLLLISIAVKEIAEWIEERKNGKNRREN